MRSSWIKSALAIGLLAGCGGSSGGAGGGGGEDTSGDEAILADPGQEASGEEAAVEEPASGPGQLRVVNQIGGTDASGNVRVLSASGEVVAEGSSGDTFTVPSGTYSVQGEITDDDVLIDTPSRDGDAEVTVVAGQEATAAIAFPVSRVRIRVTRRNRPVARWRLEVRPQGDEDAEAIELRPSQQHVAITPGRYSAVLHIGSEQITVNEVIFQGGATMDVPINLD